MSEEKIIKRVKTLRRIYMAMIILLLAVLVSSLTVFSEYDTLESVLENVLIAYIFILIYFGLRRVSQWAPPLILVSSAFNLFGLAAGWTTPYSNALEFSIGRAFEILMICFFVYQMIFFTRKEVKAHFKSASWIFF